MQRQEAEAAAREAAKHERKVLQPPPFDSTTNGMSYTDKAVEELSKDTPQGPGDSPTDARGGVREENNLELIESGGSSTDFLGAYHKKGWFKLW